MISKICPRCNQEFQAEFANKKYCLRCSGKTIKRTCERCKNVFWTTKAKIRVGKGRFCSKDCFHPPQYKPCTNCKKQVRYKPYQLKRFDNVFCSRKCYAEWKSQKTTIPCLICGEPTERKPSVIAERNFCSRKCYNKYRRDSYYVFTCRFCEQPFELPPGHFGKNMYQGVYCSPECQALDRRMDDAVRSEYNHEFTELLKEEIRKRDDYQCQMCNTQEYEIYRNLDVHHIDYDKTNNHPHNLISLCNSCHPRTNYNRDIWKRYFQYIQNYRFRNQD